MALVGHIDSVRREVAAAVGTAAAGTAAVDMTAVDIGLVGRRTAGVVGPGRAIAVDQAEGAEEACCRPTATEGRANVGCRAVGQRLEDRAAGQRGFLAAWETDIDCQAAGN